MRNNIRSDQLTMKILLAGEMLEKVADINLETLNGTGHLVILEEVRP